MDTKIYDQYLRLLILIRILLMIRILLTGFNLTKKMTEIFIIGDDFFEGWN